MVLLPQDCGTVLTQHHWFYRKKRSNMMHDLVVRISALPLFFQVIIAVIVVGIAFSILKKFVKFAVWLVILLAIAIALGLISMPQL
jgi:low affinity Fe/Cu permease